MLIAPVLEILWYKYQGYLHCIGHREKKGNAVQGYPWFLWTHFIPVSSKDLANNKVITFYPLPFVDFENSVIEYSCSDSRPVKKKSGNPI